MAAHDSNTGAQHGVVKPKKIVETGIGMLEQELVVSSLFRRHGIDEFRGTENDTLSIKVPGVLPFHDYEWRSGKVGSTTPGVRQKIKFDDYNERTHPVSFGGNAYSAVAMTDEQADMDMNRWADLLGPQVKAVARGLERSAIETVESADFEFTIGVDIDLTGGSFRPWLIEARRILNALNVPAANRFIVVGSNFEAEMLSDAKMTFADAVGANEAQVSLNEATLGRKYGFTFVVDQTIDPDSAYAFVGDAFVFLNAAPSIPQSKRGAGATASLDGITMRHLVDYSTDYLTDRSVVNTYYGFNTIKDVLVGWDGTNGVEVLTDQPHFVRAIKLELGATSEYDSTGDLAEILPAVAEEGAHLARIRAGAVVPPVVDPDDEP